MPTTPSRRAPSLVGFFAAAAALSALAFLPQVWASYRGAAAVPGPVKLLQLLLFFGPAVLAIAWAAREGGRAAVRALLAGVARWRVAPQWWLAVLLGPAALDLVALAAGRAMGIATPALPAPGRALATMAITFGAYVLLNTEELAWRGYAWPRMRDRLGPLRASLLLGVIWGLLHAPLFLMKGGHPGGHQPVLFLLMTVSFSVLFALVYEGTGGSVLIAHLFHQSLNAWGDVLPVYPRAVGSLVPAAVMVALSVAIAAVGVWRAGWRWSATTTTAEAAA